MSANIKICAGCGLDYKRPTGTSKLSDARWEERSFCSARCALGSAGGQDFSGGHAATFDGQQASARIATDALRDRMFAYYHGIARERGLANEWEAAVVLGMAA